MSIKYIFVTGGVVSGLGKGITAASLGRLLKERGYKVTIQKFDPYINVNPGTMSPYQHGEVFVTDDGAETDLDVGHYERFIDENLSVNSDITSGQVYWTVLNKERSGEYGGVTVQVIPHITNEIKNGIYRLGQEKDTDVVITEIGGTVGDIESQPFLEAIRQVVTEVGRENAIYIHVTLVPVVPGSTELKSKPTQHSVKELLSFGIQPNILVCRADHALPADMRDKLALFCSTRREDIIQNLTVSSLYEAPLMLEEEGLATSVCHHLQLENAATPPMTEWRQMISNIKSALQTVSIALVGKYTELPDAYISVMEAVAHGCIPNGAKPIVKLINSESIDSSNVVELLKEYDAILVPGGFGERGMEGKVLAAEYARKNKVPFLGVGLGMQAALIEYGRNVLKLEDCNSTEFAEKSKNPVINLLSHCNAKKIVGGEMRLGRYPCKLKKGSIISSLYGKEEIEERFRHKYQFNNDYTDQFEQAGMVFAGSSPDELLLETIELPEHPWFIGVQYHPEFKSRPNRPHPIYIGLVKAALAHKETEN